MRFISTRGLAPAVTAPEAVLEGLAPDGGLYMPDKLPRLFENKSDGPDYASLAASVFSALLPGFSPNDCARTARDAYGAQFDDPAITPIRQAGDVFVLELFHGPTAAFKDLALQALPRLMALAREKLTPDKKIMVLTATSGDTGSAAMRGFCDLPGFRVLVYYPKDGVSAVQKGLMLTMPGSNLEAVAVLGDFDAAQAGVKAAFQAGGTPSNLQLSSANSINIGRLVPQVVYYAAACRALVARGAAKPGDLIDFFVPTGNFGDIFAGFLAREMGLPIGQLVCASNANRVLTDFLKTGVYDRRRPLQKTLSPSADILVSGNLERLLFVSSGGDAPLIKGLMDQLTQKGFYQVPENQMQKIREIISADSATDEQTLLVIRDVWETRQTLLDPHTALAWHALRQLQNAPRRPRVVLATASPFKFPQAMCEALGVRNPPEAHAMEALAEKTGLLPPEPLRGLTQKPVLRDETIWPEDLVSDALGRAMAW